MRHGSLFTGIGGFDLAAYLMGWDNVFQVEKDPFCRLVLKKNFPTTKLYEDVRTFEGAPYKGLVDVLSGGFPCKQTSVGAAIHGKRIGLQVDDSGLWYHQIRIIREMQPEWAIVENPGGVIKFEYIIQEGLENAGYTVSRLEEQACYHGLPHRRRRYLYVANRDGQRLEITRQAGSPTSAWFERLAASGGSWMQLTPGDGRGNNGIPNRVDRIRAIGNAIVPQMAFHVFKLIQNATDENMPLG